MKNIQSIIKNHKMHGLAALFVSMSLLVLYGKPWAQDSKGPASPIAKSPALQDELHVIDGANNKDKISDMRKTNDSTIVVTDQSIRIYYNNGSVKKELTFNDPIRTRVKVSKRGNLIAKTTAINVTEKGSERVEVEMLDLEGNTLWQSTRFGAGPFYISEANQGIVQRVCYDAMCSGSTMIYTKDNPQGKMIDSIMGIQVESNGGDISEDGQFYAVTYKENSKDYILGYYNIDGKLIWKYKAEDSLGNELALSPTGKYLVAIIRNEKSHKSRIVVFDKNGKIIQEHVSSYVGDYSIAYSDNEAFVAVGSTSGDLYAFQTSLSHAMWAYHADDGIGFIFLDAGNDGAILGSATTINANDYSDGTMPRYIICFNDKGIVVSVIEYKDHGYAYWSDGPKAIFERLSSKLFSVVLRDKIVRYER